MKRLDRATRAAAIAIARARRLVFLALCTVSFVAWLVADVLEKVVFALGRGAERAARLAKRFR